MPAPLLPNADPRLYSGLQHFGLAIRGTPSPPMARAIRTPAAKIHDPRRHRGPQLREVCICPCSLCLSPEPSHLSAAALVDFGLRRPTTPAWYLSLLQEGHVELARQYRDILKERRRWTPTMEDHFVRILQGLRRFFELVITDQPGGDLGADPPQRIPPGRERFFQQLDELILVAREGEVTWKLWHDELARHGLAHRLRVILYGSHPEAPPTLQLTRQGDLWIGTVQGLERTRTKQELVQAFQPVLEPLWEDWRQRLRSCVAEV